MPLADDLRALADRTQRELDSVHDFFEHSKIIWRTFQVFVEEGHKVVAENLATGTSIDQDGLIALAPQYTREYLAAFTFRQFISTFEVFLFDFLYRLLLHNPWQFGKSQVEFEVILKASDRDDVIAQVLWKQLNDLKFKSVRDWFLALKKAVKLDCPNDEEIEVLSEVKATRDLLEHNAGVVNEVYLRKAGKRTRYAVGDHVELDDSYHLESWKLIKKIVGEVTGSAITKLE